MSKTDSCFHVQRKLLALAAAFFPLGALAQDGAAPLSTISLGLGLLSGASADHGVFGQYNNLRPSRAGFATLGFDYSLRDPETSNWLQITGANLLGDTRELGLLKKDPGNWKLSANYGELVRYDPTTINSALVGLGTSTVQVQALGAGAGSGADFELKTKRTALGIGLAKIISPRLQFDLELKSEKKEGARLFGMGINCPSLITPGCLGSSALNVGSATLMLPEPLSANHSQVEARLGYAAQGLRLHVGYYGSFYRNHHSSLSAVIPASLYNPIGALLPLGTGLHTVLSQALALAPDNQAHQFDLSGNFELSASTRGNFKLARATATQNADFAAAGLSGAPPGLASLDARVKTNLAKLGLSSRPLPNLSLLADLRYEHKDDQTPLAAYNTEGTFSYSNRHLSSTRRNAKLQASWQLSNDIKGTLGADSEAIDRGAFSASSAISGISALRQDTQELSTRADLRARLSESLTGSVALSRSRRGGSNWLRDNSALGVTEVNSIYGIDPVNGFVPTAVFMPTLADRQRSKIRWFADWQPTESLTLQLVADSGSDRFSAPTGYGLRDSGMHQFNLDWGYALSDNWGLSGSLSSSTQSFNQARPAGSVMTFDNSNRAASVGANGKLSGKLHVGASLAFVGDRSVYAQTLDSLAGSDAIALLAASGGLPDIVYSQTALKLFGRYALEKGSSVRLDFVHQRNKVNDWTWGFNGVPYLYSDGTTVLQKPYQSVSLVGVSYVHQLH